ncbi:MAG: DNA repair protein RadC [Alloprevotella sp.]|nr:DNA repair protein RadC [Alloprevotella sp.]
MNITDLSLDDRPREKFAAHGAATLSKAELLAILIGSGNTEENAVQLMQRIMNDCQGSLATLGNMGIDSLCRYKGMGPAKAISVLAACELGRRRMAEGLELRPQLTSSADIFAYMTPRLKGTPVEECHAILLNNHLRVVGCKLISRGGITGTVVDVRLVLREALLCNATHLALCHNHPSGNPRPSGEDDRLTQKLKAAAATMDLRLIDHIILTDEAYFSYQDEGRL